MPLKMMQNTAMHACTDLCFGETPTVVLTLHSPEGAQSFPSTVWMSEGRSSLGITSPSRRSSSGKEPPQHLGLGGRCQLAPLCVFRAGRTSYSTVPTAGTADGQPLSSFARTEGLQEPRREGMRGRGAAGAPHGGGCREGMRGRVPAGQAGRSGAGALPQPRSLSVLARGGPGGAGGSCRPRLGPSRPSRPVLKAAAAGAAPAGALPVSPHRAWP